MKTRDLCKWLRDNSAGTYRPSAEAADRIEILEAALTKLRDCDWVISLPDRMDAVRDIAREALNT